MTSTKGSQGAVQGVDLKDVAKKVGSAGKSVFNALYKLSYGTYRVLNKVEVGIVKGTISGVKTLVSEKPATATKEYWHGQTKPPSTSVVTRDYWHGQGGSQSSVRKTAVGVKFNLPPHKWSLPVNQNLLSSNNVVNIAEQDHSTRRAVMWCYGYGAIDNTTYSWGNTTDSTLPSNQTTPLDTNWGFQFLWNPEKIANSLSRNANFTPSAVDKLSNLFGLFTAMEAVSFTIVIDRVNDFACIKSMTGDLDYATIASNYYAAYAYPQNPESTVDQVKRLNELGTMADIEYLFKMINGEGTNGTVWKNALDRKTADLGFLAPTAIAVQFGPNPDSLSYVGYIDGITIAHNMFTEDMIPIHSEVTVNFVAFARTSLSQK